MFGWLFGSKAKPATPPERSFPAKIAGVTYRNADRTSRQKIIIDEVSRGDQLNMRLDDGNKHDSNAVAALTGGGKQIGFFDTRLAIDIRAWLQQGKRLRFTVTDVTGGDGMPHGVNILVEVFPPAP